MPAATSTSLTAEPSPTLTTSSRAAPPKPATAPPAAVDPPAIEATKVPCPLVSSTARLPDRTSYEALTLPASAGAERSAPVSTIAIVVRAAAARIVGGTRFAPVAYHCHSYAPPAGVETRPSCSPGASASTRGRARRAASIPFTFRSERRYRVASPGARTSATRSSGTFWTSDAGLRRSALRSAGAEEYVISTAVVSWVTERGSGRAPSRTIATTSASAPTRPRVRAKRPGVPAAEPTPDSALRRGMFRSTG